MSKKAVSRTARAKAAKSKSQASLIGFVRVPGQQESLLAMISSVDQEISRCSRDVKNPASSPLAEERALTRLRELEIERFQLLGQVHGNRVNEYLLS